MPISASPSPATNIPPRRGAVKRHSRHCSPAQTSERWTADRIRSGRPMLNGWLVISTKFKRYSITAGSSGPSAAIRALFE
jgi:hypothetical protein